MASTNKIIARENIKLTLPVDLYLAEGILKYREEQNA